MTERKIRTDVPSDTPEVCPKCGRALFLLGSEPYCSACEQVVLPERLAFKIEDALGRFTLRILEDDQYYLFEGSAIISGELKKPLADFTQAFYAAGTMGNLSLEVVSVYSRVAPSPPLQSTASPAPSEVETRGPARPPAPVAPAGPPLEPREPIDGERFRGLQYLWDDEEKDKDKK